MVFSESWALGDHLVHLYLKPPLIIDPSYHVRNLLKVDYLPRFGPPKSLKGNYSSRFGPKIRDYDDCVERNLTKIWIQPPQKTLKPFK